MVWVVANGSCSVRRPRPAPASPCQEERALRAQVRRQEVQRMDALEAAEDLGGPSPPPGGGGTQQQQQLPPSMATHDLDPDQPIAV
eukprot:SAG25_NODE_429_length_8143_cov_2.591124_8_plen_86_part_00